MGATSKNLLVIKLQPKIYDHIMLTVCISFFLLMTGISMTFFSLMKQQTSVRKIYKKEMVVARKNLIHLRHWARV
uniref:Uncharacterized protein n=1 Tax=Solanum lycopersicum TaxID=4081 RepID=A0A3Q7FE74_SOLLC